MRAIYGIRAGVVVTLATILALPVAAEGRQADDPPGPVPTSPAEWAALGLQQVPKQVPDGALPTGAAAPATDTGTAAAAVNPYLSLVPDPATIDWSYWSAVGEAQAAARAAHRPVPSHPLVHHEAEAPGTSGSNDSQGAAELVDGFGTGRRQNRAARIAGASAPPAAPVALSTVEDDGAIPLATDTGITGAGAVVTDAAIGDGPHGSTGTGTGDLDFFRLRDMRAGQLLLADVDTPASDLDSVLLVWDAQGTPLAAADDDGETTDSLLAFSFPADGDYYVMVAGFPTFPFDPFDPASGIGAGSEGSYRVTIGVDTADVDYYAFAGRPGDVLGATVTGSGLVLGLFAPDGQQVMGSAQDASAAYPQQSPLPGGGNATLDHVVDVEGLHALAVVGRPGAYEVTLEAYRPEEHQQRDAVQTLFVDFDGARVNTGIFGGPGVVQLSPLSSFLAGWGLAPRQERRLEDVILATVEENLRRDLQARGGNPNFAVRLRNSRDHRDPFGQPNVSRIIVGGTIEESGVYTVGIAQSVDPGNFGHEETGLVLLDVLSGPPEMYPEASLNTYLAPNSDRVTFIGQAIGNVVSHEAGHFLGNWHVDQFDGSPNLMDQGGNFAAMFGVGPDGIGGTADDSDVDFGENVFNPGEGFVGIEDTLTRTAFGLVRGQNRARG